MYIFPVMTSLSVHVVEALRKELKEESFSWTYLNPAWSHTGTHSPLYHTMNFKKMFNLKKVTIKKTLITVSNKPFKKAQAWYFPPEQYN